MRIIGIDPGVTRCGVAVVEARIGKASLVGVDVIRTPVDIPIAERLVSIESHLCAWLERYRPEAMAIERVFAQHNLSSVMDTMQAAGVASLVGAKAGLAVTYHTPSEVKAAVTGSGKANKAQVIAMVTKILKLDAAPTVPDAADAMAVAITHAWRAPATNRYAAAVAAAKGFK